MNRRGLVTRISVPALAALLILSCTVVMAPPQATLSVGDFNDQVLDPLSHQLADDIINHNKALKALQAAKVAGQNRDFVGGLMRQIPGVPQLFSADDLAREAQLQQDLALLETRRVPLQREIRDILVKRTKTVPGGFAICLEGTERVYKSRDFGVGFTRVSDTPFVCEKVDLQSLQKTTLQQVDTTIDF